jgi:hypothetical protein
MTTPVWYNDQEWIDAVVEYPRLPDSITISVERWDRKLRHMGITQVLPECRATKRNDITILDDSRARKSIYIVKAVWDAAVARKMAIVDANAVHEASVTNVLKTDTFMDNGHDSDQESDASQDVFVTDHSGGVDAATASTSTPDKDAQNDPTTLEPVEISDNECFVFNDQRMHIKVYGERTAEGLYLDAHDVATAMNFREDNMPTSIKVMHVKINGSPRVRILPWFAFLHLAFLKRDSYPAARAISTWVSKTMFNIQYEKGLTAVPQATFASRNRPFRPGTYLEDTDTKIVYGIDFCSASDLEDAYPGTVLPLIPAGRSIHDFRGTKLGCGKKDRLSSVRSNLKQILPGCDPRPFMTERIPHVTDNELQTAFEAPLHDEYSDQRVGYEAHQLQIKRNGEKYTEVFILDIDMKEDVCRKANRMAYLHQDALRLKASTEASEAQASLAGLAEARMECRIKDTQISCLETSLQKSETSLQKRDREIDLLKQSIARLMPKKMASVFKELFSS